MTAEAVMADLEATLARVDEREPMVRAWVNRHPDDQLRADAATVPDGPLHGWTFGVKDVIDTADLPTERGSPIYAGRTTANDASCVALARSAGALVVGKTVTTEFALIKPGPTTNPHDPGRTPGGSSSGSAAAVACGMVRAAFGTQTVGSVIRPAAFCGVVGFKPTHQLVPLAGVASLAPTFDTVGWLTRSVTDAMAVFDAMTGAKTERGASSGRRRIGRYRSHQWSAAQAEMDGVLDRACGVLADGGVEVVEVDPLSHLAEVFDAADTVLRYELARVFAWERAVHEPLVSRGVQKMAATGDRIAWSEYAAAQRALRVARWAHQEYLAVEELDGLLTPSAPGEAPDVTTTGDSVFNRTWTALGVPALHLPTGLGPTGMPVGVQLTGAAWSDDDLLAVGAEMQSTLEIL
jgi:Asp-tRNA(Asn)/Glu-tRNA(Gln) amidotransferase A subunit family amidase